MKIQSSESVDCGSLLPLFFSQPAASTADFGSAAGGLPQSGSRLPQSKGHIAIRIVVGILLRKSRGVVANSATALLLALNAHAEKPNVIVIYTDDQGYGDLSCLNADAKFQTPNIDRLAEEGMTFTDGHSSDTVCTPSRYGLLTGRYSWRTELKRGVFGAEEPCLIEDGRMTLASLLASAGYETAMVGKWHLGMDFPGKWGERDWSKPVQDMPLDKGFGYYWGIPASMNYGVLAWFENRHADVPPTLYTRKKPNEIAISDYRIMPPYDKEPKGRGKNELEVAPDFVDIECLDRFTTQALKWMESKKDGEKPFFLYLPYTSPHKPVIPMEKFRGQSEAGAYGDFMMETDWHVGRVLYFLDQNDLAEYTLVFFSSDNGPENTWPKRLELYGHDSNGIYREGKRSIYEGGHRVPFLVRWPAKVKAGSVASEPVCQTDLLATVAEMVGVELPDNAGEDSVSFYGLLTGEEKESPRALIHHASDGQFAIRDGKWKLIMEHKNAKRELYDLEADPSETKNVLSQHPEVESELVKKITEIVTQGNDTELWDDVTWLQEGAR